MKKTILKFMFAITVAILISSCAAFNAGFMQNSASLSSANFSYVKQNIKGEAKATYILGIGGLAKQTLVDNAKQKMIVANTLKSNQAIANVTVNFKSSYCLIFYSRVRCTVTADVVEFR